MCENASLLAMKITTGDEPISVPWIEPFAAKALIHQQLHNQGRGLMQFTTAVDANNYGKGPCADDAGPY